MIPGMFAGACPSRTPLAISVVQFAESADNLVTYSFPGCNFGAPASDRLLIAALTARDDNTNSQINACTIGGVSATLLVRTTNGSGTGVCAALFGVALPAGASGEVTAGGGSALGDMGLTLYRIVGAASLTPVDTDAVSGGTDMNLNIPVGPSVAVGVAASAQDTTTYTWTGLDEDRDVDTDGGSSGVRHSSANRTFSAAAAGHPVVATPGTTFSPFCAVSGVWWETS